MSKTRNLSDLLDANGDVKSTALDNVPASDVVNDTSPQLGGDLSTNGNDINFGDNDKAQFGAGNDLQIYSNGADGFIKEVDASGYLYIQGTNLRLQNTAGTQTYVNANDNGAVDLRYAGSTKIATTSGGIDITGTASVAGNVDLRDSDKLLLGDSDDLQIYHNGSNSYIYDAGAGHLYVQGTNLWLTNADGSKNYLNGNSSTGNVSLFYGTDEKLRTTPSGFTAYGTVTATAFSGDGSGLTNVPAGVSSVNMRVFTSSTTYTPTSGTKFFLVYCTGGGGGSGGGNSAGNASFHAIGGAGAGGTAIRTYNATEMGATASISIGGGGGAGSSGSGGVGGTGGTSTFNPAGTGTTLTGNGGTGSQTLYADSVGNSPAGLGGTASGGIINKKGEDGLIGDYGRSGVNLVNNQGGFCQQSGSGGNSFWGQGGAAKIAENGSNLLISGESGSLGGGASGLATRDRSYQVSGTAGSSGVVVIMEYA